MEKEKIHDWMLERYLLEELPESRMNEIKQLLDSDSELRKRLTALEKSNKSILKKYPPKDIAKEIMLRYSEEVRNIEKKKPINYKYILIPSFIFATTAVIFFIVFPVQHTINPVIQEKIKLTDNMSIKEYGIRLKGMKTDLFIYRKKNNKIETLKDGSFVKESDLLQIAYTSEGNSYGTIFSIDGRGTVTVHYPKDKSTVKIKVNRKVNLPVSYELDDAPRFERFFLVTSKKNFNLNNIISAAKILAQNPDKALKDTLKIDGSFQQISMTLLKGK